MENKPFLENISSVLQSCSAVIARIPKLPWLFWPLIVTMFSLYGVLMMTAQEVMTNPDGTKNAGPIDLWMHFFDADEVYVFLGQLTDAQMRALKRGWTIDLFAFILYIPGLGALWSAGWGKMYPRLMILNLWPIFIAPPDTIENLGIGQIFRSYPEPETLIASILGYLTPIKEVVANGFLLLTLLGCVTYIILGYQSKRSSN